MKRSQLALAITGLLASSTSYAAIDYVNSPTDLTKAPSVWAKELAGNQSSTITLRATSDQAGGNKGATPLNVRLPVGFKVPAASVYYIRLDLSNNAKFATDPNCTLNNTQGVCLKSTGGANSSFVTFKLEAVSSTGAVGISPTDGVVFDVSYGDVGGTKAGIIVADTNSPISLAYSLHTNKDSAESASFRDTAKLAGQTIDYIKFAPGIISKFEKAGLGYLTSDVAAGFLSFREESNVAQSEKAELGQFTYGVETGVTVVAGTYNPVMVNAATGSTVLVAGGAASTASTLSWLVSDTSTSLEISSGTPGGFSFLQDASGTTPSGTYSTATGKIFLAPSTVNCTSPGSSITNATSVAADKVVLPLKTANGGGTYKICLTANKASIISNNDYTAKFVPGALSTTKPESTSGAFRSIVQNGTVLDTPFVTLFPGYISRVVFSNTGNSDFTYEAVVVTDDGATATLGTKGKGSIAANKLTEVNTSELVTLSGKPRGAVRFTIAGANQNIGGVFQVVKISPTVGDVQNLPLIRKGGNYDPQ